MSSYQRIILAINTVISRIFAAVVVVKAAAMSAAAELPLIKFKSAAADKAAALTMTTAATVLEITVTMARIIHL